jgi:DNA-binding HxlR family transcriptional regulator
MASISVDYDASFQKAVELIGKRWSGAVIRALRHDPVRFNHLLLGIPGISDRVLTERLRELEAEGLAERLVDPGPPVRVSYRLTATGQALAPVISALDIWARQWMEREQSQAS